MVAQTRDVRLSLEMGRGSKSRTRKGVPDGSAGARPRGQTEVLGVGVPSPRSKGQMSREQSSSETEELALCTPPARRPPTLQLTRQTRRRDHTVEGSHLLSHTPPLPSLYLKEPSFAS